MKTTSLITITLLVAISVFTLNVRGEGIDRFNCTLIAPNSALSHAAIVCDGIPFPLPCNDTFTCSAVDIESGRTFDCYGKLLWNEYHCEANCSTKKCLLEPITSTSLPPTSASTITTEEQIVCLVGNASKNDGELQTQIECQHPTVSGKFFCNETFMCLNPGTEICYDENQSTGNTCKFDCDNDISRCIYEKFESTVLATTEPLVDCAVTYSRNGSTFATQSFSLSFACGNGEWYSKERPVPPCTNTDHEEIVVGRDSNNNDITCLFNCAHSKTSCHLKRFGEELTQAAPVTIGYCDGEEFTNFTTNQTTTTFNCSEHHVEFEWTGDCNSDEEKTLYTDKNKTLTCLYNCSSDSIPPRCQLIYTASPEKLGASAAAGLPAIWTILIIMAVLATLIFIALLAVRWYIDKRARKTGSFDVAYHNNSNTVCTNPDR